MILDTCKTHGQALAPNGKVHHLTGELCIPNYVKHYKGFDVHPSEDSNGRLQFNARPDERTKEENPNLFPIAARDMNGLAHVIDAMLVAYGNNQPPRPAPEQ